MEEIIFEGSNDTAPENLQVDGPQADQAVVEFPASVGSDEGVTSSSEAPLIVEHMQKLFTAISQLQQDFDTKVKYDDSKEYLITSLHKELQFHREGLHFRVLKPIFIDLISLYSDMSTLIDSLQQDPSFPNHQQAQHLVAFQVTVEEILHRNGVDFFSCEQTTFVPSKQRAFRTIATSQPEEDKCIARRVRPGFEFEGKLLQPELVEIYKYTPNN